MPMIDAFIPEHALTPEAEGHLLEELTDILIRAEGYDPGNPVAQRISVLYLHRPAAVLVGGEPSKLPRYRIIPSAPEGQYTDESRATLVKEITEAVARAENTPFEEIAPRVWIFPTEIPDGQWGAKGIILRLPDIHAMLAGEEKRHEGVDRLARRRKQKALVTLEAARSDVRAPGPE
ncbi:tautomerase family protein [Dyella soli]|uniref:Tautomerase enzyme n=1 Tax=Dyella soli TaxID=522319 RepID=A0A4R0YR66_9GAMM|nr:tautomerase family protein [Dyella soli]TCI07351.1 Tautomerase enzyme [Dyella soli]